jgi:hypothetical protein
MANNISKHQQAFKEKVPVAVGILRSRQLHLIGSGFITSNRDALGVAAIGR